MSVEDRELRRILHEERAAPFDGFGVVVALVVGSALAILALPFFGETPVRPDLALAVGLALVAAVAALQWLALLRRFGFSPTPLPVAAGVVATVVLAAYHGQVGAVAGLSGGLVACYVWRILQASEQRFHDVAFSVSAVAVFGFLPAQAVLLRRIPFGVGGFYVFLASAFAFVIAQSALTRPTKAGPSGADLATVAAGVVAVGVGALGGLLAGAPYGAGKGAIVGLAVGVVSGAGRAAWSTLAPAPLGRFQQPWRRPLLGDAIGSVFFAAPAAFFSVRALLA